MRETKKSKPENFQRTVDKKTGKVKNEREREREREFFRDDSFSRTFSVQTEKVLLRNESQIKQR